ncbi:MAG: NDP-sugar synthase, partial [Thermoproteota archaeon]|nr:NDP-sugar synthase [Thermoproteota archaeon]
LRPLTCTRPKLLVPILNQPLLDWTLKGLAKEGIKEVILAVNYMAEAFMNHYGKSKYGIKLHYSKEEKPLGTGGPIKKAEALINHVEPFFVLNGDILTNINYGDLARKHEENCAVATIALHQVKRPSRYGTVELTKNNHITRFVEKPTRGEEPSNLVNAGIYVLDPKIFDYISTSRPVSIEREVFPKLAKKGMLYGYVFEDVWLDIGEPADYFKANWLLLNTQAKREFLGKNAKMETDIKIVPPINVAEKVVVGEKSKIGPYTIIGENVTIGKDVSIQKSIVFPETRVSDFASIYGAIIGEDVTIGKHVKIEEGCIVGDHVTIQDNVILPRGVAVCPYKKVSESMLIAKYVT